MKIRKYRQRLFSGAAIVMLLVVFSIGCDGVFMNKVDIPMLTSDTKAE